MGPGGSPWPSTTGPGQGGFRKLKEVIDWFTTPPDTDPNAREIGLTPDALGAVPRDPFDGEPPVDPDCA
ncbi:hypothetical protein ACRAKI_29570 [Saccharothrix isguenensis]